MREMSDFETLSLEEKAVVLRKLRTDVRKLESISANSGTPKAIVDKFIRVVYQKRAREVVASLVNEAAWDGRICAASKRWAHRVDGAWDGKAMDRMGVATHMHPAHLDEIAYEMAKREAK